MCCLRLSVFTLSVFGINLYHPETASSVKLNLIWDCFYGALLACKVFGLCVALCKFDLLDCYSIMFLSCFLVTLRNPASLQSNTSEVAKS